LASWPASSIHPTASVVATFRSRATRAHHQNGSRASSGHGEAWKWPISKQCTDTSPLHPCCPVCFSAAAVSYPAATGSVAIRRTMLAEKRRVRWLPANSSQSYQAFFHQSKGSFRAYAKRCSAALDGLSPIGKSRPAALGLISTGARSALAFRSVVETRIGEDYGRYRELFRPSRGCASIRLAHPALAELLDDLVMRHGAADHRKFSTSSRWRKPASAITDRAKRDRSQRLTAAGPMSAVCVVRPATSRWAISMATRATTAERTWSGIAAPAIRGWAGSSRVWDWDAGPGSSTPKPLAAGISFNG